MSIEVSRELIGKGLEPQQGIVEKQLVCEPATQGIVEWDWAQMLVEEVLIGGVTGFAIGIITTYFGLKLFYRFKERERQIRRDANELEKYRQELLSMLSELKNSLLEDTAQSLQSSPQIMRVRLDRIKLKYSGRSWDHESEFALILDAIEAKAFHAGGMAQSYAHEIEQITRIALEI